MKEIQKSVAAQKAIFNGLENEWIKHVSGIISRLRKHCGRQ